jgi:hypothetical protein
MASDTNQDIYYSIICNERLLFVRLRVLVLVGDGSSRIRMWDESLRQYGEED